MDDDQADFESLFSGLGVANALAENGIFQAPSLPNINGLGLFIDPMAGGADDDGAVGVGEGDEWEDEVDLEIRRGDDLPGAYEPPMMNDIVMDGLDGLFESEPPRKRRRKSRVAKAERLRPKDVQELFPSFEPGGILNFTELFKGRIVAKSRIKVKKYNVEPVAPKERSLAHAKPLKDLIGDAKAVVQKSNASVTPKAPDLNANLVKLLKSRNDGLLDTFPLDERSYDLVLLSDWESQILYEPPLPPTDRLPLDDVIAHGAETADALSLSRPRNLFLESDDWLQTIVWDVNQPHKDFRDLPFDPEPLRTEVAPPLGKPAGPVARTRKRLRLDNNTLKDKFNLSNDQFYEVSKEKSRVRQTFGQLIVEHAYPAQKLQLPFYKTRLSKNEARSYHRPALQFPVNLQINFSKVRGAKRKKDKGGRRITRGDLTEGLRTTGDISLRDTSSFALFEYSEEYPAVLSNFGMSSLLVNYYRKRNEADEYIPKLDIGEPFILEPADESPFMRHGHVAHGETVPALYNNLYRAPLFRHKPAPSDFLVIRSSTKGESKYYIREIKNLFVVGQTFPVTEVPGPHSRKITNTIKGRLQTIAFRLLGKSKEGRIKIPRLLKYFPDENELQMKQRLKPFIKEFMEFHRTGPHQGYWRLKTTFKHPTKAEMLRIVEPEHVVLSEGMIVGSQHLVDSGYGKAELAETEKDDAGDDANKMSIEQQLAPWMTTKSFVSAATKGTLMKLHGEGDPTGRGEAFNFIRVSAKTPFVKAGEDPEAKEAEVAAKTKSQHKYTVADQHQAYRSEIDRIWKAQNNSLSNPIPPAWSDDEDEPHPSQSISRRGSVQPQFGRRDLSPSGFSDKLGSRAGSVGFAGSQDGRQGEPSSNRVLRIRRLVEKKWRTEIIRDPRVIAAYLDQKRAQEDAMLDLNDYVPTGDADVDARYAKKILEEVARLKKNQDRRLLRKNAQIVEAGGTPIGGNNYVRQETSRKCGNCGQVGHMKTNRKCPRWAEFNTEGGPISATSPPAATASSPPPPGASAMSPPSSSTLGISRDGFFGASPSFRQPSFNAPAVPSPLATSPPATANEWPEEDAGPAAPKKIMLKMRK